jgi:hypothetical protein
MSFVLVRAAKRFPLGQTPSRWLSAVTVDFPRVFHNETQITYMLLGIKEEEVLWQLTPQSQWLAW